jgi:hypothetical protein
MPEHVILRGRRQSPDIRKGLDKSQIVGDHGRDLGLLQHDLRYPSPVRIPGLLPGKVMPAMLLLPLDQLFCQMHFCSISEGGVSRQSRSPATDFAKFIRLL